MSYQQQFIDTYSKLATLGSLGSPVLPSVIMAQAIVESGYGQDPTATQANNFFGIKVSPDWYGPTIKLPTPNDPSSAPSYVSTFRKYIDASESFRDHITFFYNNPRYKANGLFDASTPEEQCLAIANAHYAEAFGYADKLMSVINEWNLRSLDKKKVTCASLLV